MIDAYGRRSRQIGCVVLNFGHQIFLFEFPKRMPGIKHNKRYVPYSFDKTAPIDTAVEGAKMIIVRFKDSLGEALANQFSIPASSTPDNLNLLLNKLISPEDGDEPLPYAFTVDSREISRSLLADVILPMALSSSEAVIDITYSPQVSFFPFNSRLFSVFDL
jgi:hypothetical protein